MLVNRVTVVSRSIGEKSLLHSKPLNIGEEKAHTCANA